MPHELMFKPKELSLVDPKVDATMRQEIRKRLSSPDRGRVNRWTAAGCGKDDDTAFGVWRSQCSNPSWQ